MVRVVNCFKIACKIVVSIYCSQNECRALCAMCCMPNTIRLAYGTVCMYICECCSSDCVYYCASGDIWLSIILWYVIIMFVRIYFSLHTVNLHMHKVLLANRIDFYFPKQINAKIVYHTLYLREHCTIIIFLII